MDIGSTFEKRVEQICGKIPARFAEIFKQLLHSYQNAVGAAFSKYIPTWLIFIELLEEQLEKPFEFEPYHKKIRTPVDYYRFGVDFLFPVIDLTHSHVMGLDRVDAIADQLARGENVILFANHQSEADPQAIAVLLERTHPAIAEKIIYVAGERVISDPLAIPFSMGCDLLCIYSKRYIDHPPELKAQKQIHNKQTMEKMSRLLQEGGKIIYVAPGGGRDRRNSEGVIELAPFDPDSIEMFHLMARKAKTTTHFYPLAVDSYSLLPPPETIQRELGESRTFERTPTHLFFGPAFDMENFTGSEESDRLKRRKRRAEELWSIVNQQYQFLKGLS